ncbi:hypothetical protein MJO28_003827 [Puccinia striiformis f. sp. tritici]|uniref:U6 snRNA-associated Sm-like protein LSm1 n=3 Tax=Puccinia striiformis TaxID=27350 RepID=A0A0L0V4M3_9BASI|nr:hypothetical protein Pst134EA_007557 [Puccinia striiformis f. sp. tritici]KAI9611095.1 hypothetical protein H4Q26_008944 [Puccinia striiformis f. sp. tritici PST-130]KNE94136.1 hypothetical protein PSTG_12566 [Puccinia striiformis f. sp. tritici PST-78]POW09667.1 hypothetical protein PSTT_06685 [Puccinia striiformis]KAH9460503.1 hypothetical protein Pst134EB_008674 [Puccinia striiformis f. sp. tritici]KAH9470292.1 hypothetical protein Pst134EA_007557 [Puccinia striiformis f. sp. tritici]
MDNFLTNVPFTTSGALVDTVDKKIIVSLRDGKTLIGVLRSYDQFANLVLQDTIERIHVGINQSTSEANNEQQQEQETIAEGSSNQKPGQTIRKKKKSGGICKYTDIWKGIYLVRGENVVLLGEIDLDKEDEIISKFDLEKVELVTELQRIENQSKSDRIKSDEKILFDQLGFSKEGDEDDRY